MIMHDAKIYLCRPDRTPICELNGKQIKSVSYERNLKDFNVLTLNVDKFIDIDGQLVKSNGYDLLHDHMILYLENLDYFQLQEPTPENDGQYEYKILEAYSDEKIFEDKDLVGLSFNKGTTDSMEMLADNNVDAMGFAKEYISFCNYNNHQLSLLHLVLEYTPGWTVGYVDNALASQKFSFEADGTNAYSFLNTTVSNVAKCIFDFDTIHKKVNVYYKDNIGMKTNIFISERNLIQTFRQAPQTDSLYNCLTVEGDDNLDIRAVNFGDREIYNLDYYLNTNYFDQSTIDKVHKWAKWRNDNRQNYINNGKKAAEYQEKIDEITYRVPNDGCNIAQYKTMDKDTLEKTLKMYQQMMTTIQASVDTRSDWEKWDNPNDFQNRVYQPYRNIRGEVDHDKYLQLLKEDNSGYYTYLELKDYIIPNIQIAIYNYQVPSDKQKDYNEAFETNWDLYGIKELEGKRDEYNKQILVQLAKYQKDWNAMSDSEKQQTGMKDEAAYNVFHKEYVKYKNYLGNEYTKGALLYKLKELKGQVDSLTKQQDSCQNVMNDLAKKARMNHSQFGLTNKEYEAIQNVIRMGSYTNSNILTTSLDSAISAYDRKEELYQDGLDRIVQTSSPQYQIITALDNLLALDEYADIDNKQGWQNNFDVGNFIIVGLNDEYAVQLRLFTFSYNPCTKATDINVTYTNMINHLTGVDDFTYLFDDTVADLKNSIAAGTGNAKDSVEYMTNMLQRMTSSQLFKNAVSGTISNLSFINAIGDYLDCKTINVGQITGDDAQFKTLFSKYINSEYITANSADLQTLKTSVANIRSALVGTSSTETGMFINLNASNAKIDQAWIANLVAERLTVADLVAGDITLSDKMRILSENGNLVFSGNTLQFLNSKNEVGIQIGYGKGENPSLIIKDEKGATILTSQGITKDAIADGLIVNDMLGKGSISKDKLNFPIIEPNKQGGIDITQIYDGEGGLWGIDYNNYKESVNSSLDEIDSKMDEIGYNIILTSSTGARLGSDGTSTISITLTKNGTDVTDNWTEEHFDWCRKSSDTDGDIYWNEQHSGTKSVTINRKDIMYGATFGCSFVVDGETLATTLR